MTDVTRILNQIEQGDPSASEELLPIVYEELRVLARRKLANEKPGQTLQATALVHEAYMRLVGKESEQSWDNRGHFFAAAAEAMRRILVETYRRRATEKHGGNRNRVALDDADGAIGQQKIDLLELNDAIEVLSAKDKPAADLAKLRIFAGLSVDEAAQLVGMPHTSAYRQWAYAQAWLKANLAENQ